MNSLFFLFVQLEENHTWQQEVTQRFRSFLQKALQSDRTDELSDDPMTQDLLRQLREEMTDA